MSKLSTLWTLILNNPSYIQTALCDNIRQYKISHFIPDRIYLKWVYKVHLRKTLNFDTPRSFNEKLQWLKLYDRNPLYTMMVDKLAVKDYIASKIGHEYIIPTLDSWNNANLIDFEKLPNQFVLKCNHDSQSIIICKDKSMLDIKKVKSHLDKCMRTNLFWWGREWPYKNVKPTIFAEKYIEEDDGNLRDYKFMCFNGQVKCSFVCSERFDEDGLKVTFFDRNWKKMPFTRHYPSSNKEIPKPQNYEQMILLAEKLSTGLKFVRVDFYEVKGHIYFGELTFFPGSGFEEFTPDSWDEKIGDWIQL